MKRTLAGPGGRYEKGDVYFVSEQSMGIVRKSMAEKKIPNAVDFIPVNAVWDPFTFSDPHEILIIRTGGIGDLIALSTIAEYCAMNTIKFVTAKSLFPVFQWYSSNNIFPKSVEEPIYKRFTPGRISFIKQHTRRFYAEGLIEAGSGENWYDIFFGMIGVEKLLLKYMRPQLKKTRLPGKSNIETSVPSILMVHRGTSQMRSMQFATLYESIREATATMGEVTIYVHIDNLTIADLKYVKAVNDPNLRIIKASDVYQYLLDCYDVTVTISVDTAAVHFREGVNRPGIGIYSAFTTDARTKYYTATHSFNLKSECDLQPCFIHQKYAKHVCPRANEGDQVAPCMSTKLNRNVKAQIISGIRNYLEKHLLQLIQVHDQAGKLR